MAYIYCISKGRKGYIGLAKNSSSSVDYNFKLGVITERLDRMLQHIDNAYGLPNSYHLNDDVLQYETSISLNQALQEGAYTCNFSYDDDESSCYGVGIEYYNDFSTI